ADAAEAKARADGDAATLASAKDYTGQRVDAEAKARADADAAEAKARADGDAATLASAKDYTGQRVDAEAKA
ncbi:hemagluttinin domain-containing protein, partial [Pseudomonas aeruginosa]|nr:hemagluttinin domain-containing protein [Pseudomonas aeruginosa]MBY9629939.1 hemagluttinin domain-containing protein [Pseudomonas aeruginosa]MBY9756660.1 hemagluttinin domain-containing protein [Pseudomonas aeruginosa]